MKKLTFTRFFIFLAGIMLMTSLNSCLKDNDNNYIPQAALFMINGYLPSNGVMYASDNSRLLYNPIGYKEYTVSNIFPGSRGIRVFNDNQQEIASGTFTFRDSTIYTSFVYGLADDVGHLIVEDKVVDDLGNKSAWRFYHLSPSVEKVNLYLNNKETPLYTDRVYQLEEEADNENATYVAQTSGRQTLIVTGSDNETLVERSYDFEEGRHYSIILIGDSESSTRPLYIGIVPQYKR